MKLKILLVGIMLAVLLTSSLIYLRNNLAVGEAPEATQGQQDLRAEIMAKLDQIIANQNIIFSRLDEIEALVENTRVRATR